MKEEDRSSVWDRFKDAKRHAFEELEGEDAAPDAPRTLEELEAAIAKAAESSGIPETGMPPRASVHPSSRRNWSRWFYRALVALFAALVSGLFWWGNQQ